MFTGFRVFYRTCQSNLSALSSLQVTSQVLIRRESTSRASMYRQIEVCIDCLVARLAKWPEPASLFLSCAPLLALALWDATCIEVLRTVQMNCTLSRHSE